MSKFWNQYKHMKRRYAHAVILLQVGDFYEAFEKDAQILHDSLGVTLTVRHLGEQSVKMAGFPMSVSEGYIRDLRARGWCVAVCNQVGNTAVDGVIPREVSQELPPLKGDNDATCTAQVSDYSTVGDL